MSEAHYQRGQTQDFREPRELLRTSVASMNTIAGRVAEFVDRFQHRTIYTLEDEQGEVKLFASDLRDLLEERNYDRNLIERLERAYPQVADELKLHAP